MRYSFAVVRASPERYAAWVVGGATRVVGRSFVANLPCALAILTIALVWPWHLLARRQIGVAPVARLDVPVMAVLAILWFLGGRRADHPDERAEHPLRRDREPPGRADLHLLGGAAGVSRSRLARPAS